jgi:hypothetical protein
MTPKEQQQRRRELHALNTGDLRRLYVRKSGRLLFEVRAMFDGLSDEGRQVMIDSIIHRENS